MTITFLLRSSQNEVELFTTEIRWVEFESCPLTCIQLGNVVPSRLGIEKCPENLALAMKFMGHSAYASDH